MDFTIRLVYLLQAVAAATVTDTSTESPSSAGTVSILDSCGSVKKQLLRNASCTFDHDLCSYQNLNAGASWVRSNKHVGGFLGFRTVGDHTGHNGYLLQPDAGSPKVANRASFELALPSMTLESICIDFWYSKRGSSNSRIQVLLECSSGRRNILLNVHANSNNWKQKGILLQMVGTYRIIFKMEKEGSHLVTGLDDVNVYDVRAFNNLLRTSKPVFCEQTTVFVFLTEPTTASIPLEFYGDDPAINCTFENGSCSWHQGKGGDFDWHIGDTKNVQGLSAPRSDHTIGHGRYAFIRGREAKNSTWKAILESNTIESDVPLQFSFWYLMQGSGIGNLTVYQNFSNGQKWMLWSRSGRQGPDWTQAFAILTPGIYTLYFEASTKYHYRSDLAIDDTSLTNITLTTTTHAPSTTTMVPIQLPLSCDFEEDMCGFRPPVSSFTYAEWSRTRSPMIVLNRTYVKGDNTTGTGFFLTLAAMSDEAQRGDVASILTPLIESPVNLCFKLAFIMPSRISGTLTVYRRMARTGNLELLKHVSGYHKKEWHSILIDLERSSAFQILIQGSYAGEPGAVVGVDDLSLETGECPKVTTTSPPPPTTTTLPSYEVYNNTCDKIISENPDPQWSCSFETNLCSYVNEGQQLSWIQHNGTYDKIRMGHTDKYLVTDTKSYRALHGSTAEIKSPVVNSSSICLTFWYILPSSYSNLKVLIQFPSGGKAEIWSKDGPDLQWQNISLSISVISVFTVVIQSTKRDIFGPVGIDDIEIYSGSEVSSTRTLIPESSSTPHVVHSQPTKTTSNTRNTAFTEIVTPSNPLYTISTNTVLSSIPHHIGSTSASLKTSPRNTGPTKAFSFLSSTHFTAAVTSGSQSNSVLKITSTTPNPHQTGTKGDNSTSVRQRGLGIGLSVSVFCLCGIVLATYLLKKKFRKSNSTVTDQTSSVQMEDFSKKDISENQSKVKPTKQYKQEESYRKLDV